MYHCDRPSCIARRRCHSDQASYRNIVVVLHAGIGHSCLAGQLVTDILNEPHGLTKAVSSSCNSNQSVEFSTQAHTTEGKH